MSESMTRAHPSRLAEIRVPLPWLTVETTLWALLVACALLLRLLRLDAAPLSSTEARDALAAWRFASGGGLPDTAGYSPLLFSAQWFSFLILGASEASARLLPVLAGTALVLAPALLRQQLGRVSALAAGALLAVSPTALTLSRTASGEILVALGAVLGTAGLWRWMASVPGDAAPNISRPVNVPSVRGHATGALQMIALSLGLLLVSAPLAYSALLALGCALLAVRVAGTRRGESWRDRGARPVSGRLASRALGLLAVSVVLLSTAFGWNLQGLAAAADLLPRWLDGFVRWPDSLSFGYPGLVLVFYEPLLCLLGSAGMALAALRGDRHGLFLGAWTIVALLLALIRPGHGPGDVLLVSVPLACLAGVALAALLRSLSAREGRLSTIGYLIITLPLWAYLALNLTVYSSRPDQYTQVDLLLISVSLPTFLGLVAATGLLIVVLVAGMGYATGHSPALRGLGLSTALVLLLYTVSVAWGVSQNRPADARELLVLQPTAPDLRLLRETLSRLSIEHRGGPQAIDVTIMTDEPALAWALRDFQSARVTDGVGAPALSSAVIAPQTAGPLPVGGEYIGQSFPLRQSSRTQDLTCHWTPLQLGSRTTSRLDCSSLINWLIYRRTPDGGAEERVVLWVRRNLFNE